MRETQPRRTRDGRPCRPGRSRLAAGLLLVLALAAAACSGSGEGTPTSTTVPAATSQPGLGDLRPPQGDYLAGCAAETARDLAAFEAVLAEGEPTLPELCAVVGPPDWEDGSGLLIVIYDLDDGGRVGLGYGGPQDLVYARWIGPGGDERVLFGF